MRYIFKRKIKKITSNSHICEFNKSGKVIYCENLKTKLKVWKEYDNRGNIIHIKWNFGYEVWYEYDDKDRIIHDKNSNGRDRRYEYNDLNKIVHIITTDFEAWIEYHEIFNEEIHYRQSNGFESWTEYNDEGIKVYYKDNTGVEREYNDSGTLVMYKNPRGVNIIEDDI